MTPKNKGRKTTHLQLELILQLNLQVGTMAASTRSYFKLHLLFAINQVEISINVVSRADISFIGRYYITASTDHLPIQKIVAVLHDQGLYNYKYIPWPILWTNFWIHEWKHIGITLALKHQLTLEHTPISSLKIKLQSHNLRKTLLGRNWWDTSKIYWY